MYNRINWWTSDRSTLRGFSIVTVSMIIVAEYTHADSQADDY